MIGPARLAPAMVCLTWQADGDESPSILHHSDPACEATIRGWLLDPDVRLVGHNVSYDMGVIAQRFPHLVPLIFAKYDADLVTDTQIRQWLLDVAAGRYPKGARAKGAYTLERLAKRCANIELQKDGWRYSYVEFLDYPIAQWVERARTVQNEARETVALLKSGKSVSDVIGELDARSDLTGAERLSALFEALAEDAEITKALDEMVTSAPEQCILYPLEDACATLAVYRSQESHASYLDDQYRQARAYFALHLSSAWGLRTDLDGVDTLRRETEDEIEECLEDLIAAGLVRKDGSRDTKAAKARMIRACNALDIPYPATDKHDPRKTPEGKLCTVENCTEHISLDAEACEESEDEILIRYAEFSTLKKVLSNDIKALAKGVRYPIHTRYGFAETGRTTSSKPNIQNWARGRKCKACNATGELKEAA